MTAPRVVSVRRARSLAELGLGVERAQQCGVAVVEGLDVHVVGILRHGYRTGACRGAQAPVTQSVHVRAPTGSAAAGQVFDVGEVVSVSPAVLPDA